MSQVRAMASLAGLVSSLPPRAGLLNPATRFRKLLPYIGVTLVLIIAVAGYATIREMAASRNWLGRGYQVKSELADLELRRSVLRVYVASPSTNEGSQARVQSSIESMHQALVRLRDLTRDDDTLQQILSQLEPLAERHMKAVERLVRSETNLGGLSDYSAAAYRADDAAITDMLVRINVRETELLAVRQNAWDRQSRRNIAVVAFALGACLLLLGTNLHFLRVDVRSSRVAAQHIRESADSYRALSARIIGLQDAERRRIGRELHDSVGQSLAALQMNLQQLAARETADVGKLLAESCELVRRTAQEVRIISHLLHPPLLDLVGFVPAARNYTEQFATRSGLEAHVNFPQDLPLPSKEAELVLFRVLQESLTNVHRHAHAHAVNVWLARRGPEVILTIQDDGCGLPPIVMQNFSAGMASGVGLGGMRERLAEFGGKLDVESSQRGTIVRASIPC
jgi:signal transduction histidine kinase